MPAWDNDPFISTPPTSRRGTAAALAEAQLKRAQRLPAPPVTWSPETRNGVRGQISSRGEFKADPVSAADKAHRAVIGKATATARVNLPMAVDRAKRTSGLIKAFLDHKGFGAVIGAPDPFKGGLYFANVPGSAAADAQTYYDQIGGQAFLEGVQSLRGTGPVAVLEGLAAQAAVTRMRAASSENEFKRAAQEYVDAMQAGVRNLRLAARGSFGEEASPPAPEGVSPEEWEAMTPEEKSLWSR